MPYPVTKTRKRVKITTAVRFSRISDKRAERKRRFISFVSLFRRPDKEKEPRVTIRCRPPVGCFQAEPPGCAPLPSRIRSGYARIASCLHWFYSGCWRVVPENPQNYCRKRPPTNGLHLRHRPPGRNIWQRQTKGRLCRAPAPGSAIPIPGEAIPPWHARSPVHHNWFQV